MMRTSLAFVVLALSAASASAQLIRGDLYGPLRVHYPTYAGPLSLLSLPYELGVRLGVTERQQEKLDELRARRDRALARIGTDDLAHPGGPEPETARTAARRRKLAEDYEAQAAQLLTPEQREEYEGVRLQGELSRVLGPFAKAVGRVRGLSDDQKEKLRTLSRKMAPKSQQPFGPDDLALALEAIRAVRAILNPQQQAQFDRALHY